MPNGASGKSSASLWRNTFKVARTWIDIGSCPSYSDVIFFYVHHGNTWTIGFTTDSVALFSNFLNDLGVCCRTCLLPCVTPLDRVFDVSIVISVAYYSSGEICTKRTAKRANCEGIKNTNEPC